MGFIGALVVPVVIFIVLGRVFMAIYREGGILKRLRATPLSPVTIRGTHVVVKLTP